MTTTSEVDTSLYTIGTTVPDAFQAADFVGALLGVQRRDRGDGRADVEVGSSTLQFQSSEVPKQAPPRLVDIGTNHLCFTVGDIERATNYLDARGDVTVLGDIITIPEGPIAGNRWIYFRSPWGTLFELQQWPDEPAYFGDTDARLRHPRTELPAAQLPTARGLDHTGYSVEDLDATIERLVTIHSATEVLRTEIAANRDFMTAQFDLDVEGTSKMAMVSAGELNIELFQHSVGRQDAPRSSTAVGGNHLSIRGTGLGSARWSPGVL